MSTVGTFKKILLTRSGIHLCVTCFNQEDNFFFLHIRAKFPNKICIWLGIWNALQECIRFIFLAVGRFLVPLVLDSRELMVKHVLCNSSLIKIKLVEV